VKPVPLKPRSGEAQLSRVSLNVWYNLEVFLPLRHYAASASHHHSCCKAAGKSEGFRVVAWELAAVQELTKVIGQLGLGTQMGKSIGSGSWGTVIRKLFEKKSRVRGCHVLDGCSQYVHG